MALLLYIRTMTDKRKLWISIGILKDAINDKDKLKALSFAVAIKLSFRNSGLKSTTNRGIQKIFYVSSSTASRVVKDGLKYGYLRNDDRIGMLIANKIKEDGCWNCKLFFDQRPQDLVECPYTLKEIGDELRKAFLLNHISKQTDTVNTIKGATEGRTQREIQKAQRKLKRMPPATGCYEQLSLNAISSLIKVCKTKARRLKNSLLSSKDIVEREVKVLTSINPYQFSPKSMNAWYRKTGYYGWFMHGQGCIVCQLSNVYIYNSNRICFR